MPAFHIGSQCRVGPSLLDLCAIRPRDDFGAHRKNNLAALPIRRMVLLPRLTPPINWRRECGRTFAWHKGPSRNLTLISGRWMPNEHVRERGAGGTDNKQLAARGQSVEES